MNLVIIGAGGLAREVFDLAKVCFVNDPNFKIKGFLSLEPSNIEQLGYPKVLENSSNYEIEEDDVFFLRHRKCIAKEKSCRKYYCKRRGVY